VTVLLQSANDREAPRRTGHVGPIDQTERAAVRESSPSRAAAPRHAPRGTVPPDGADYLGVRLLGASRYLVRSPRMEVSMYVTATEAVLSVTGELDLVGGDELEAALREVIDDGHRVVALHLAGLEFIDSAGLAAIADAAVRIRTLGGRLLLRSVSPQTLRLLRVTDVDRLVELDPDHADWRRVQPIASHAEPLPVQHLYIKAETAEEVTARQVHPSGIAPSRAPSERRHVFRVLAGTEVSFPPRQLTSD
jgi:anti-sigma B factor antagonist